MFYWKRKYLKDFKYLQKTLLNSRLNRNVNICKIFGNAKILTPYLKGSDKLAETR